MSSSLSVSALADYALCLYNYNIREKGGCYPAPAYLCSPHGPCKATRGVVAEQVVYIHKCYVPSVFATLSPRTLIPDVAPPCMRGNGIIHEEVIYMRENFTEICHGCGRELYTYEHYWKAKLGGRTGFTFFHNGCYKHYRTNNSHNVVWAEEKNAVRLR